MTDGVSNTVLIIDDDPGNLAASSAVLKGSVRLKVANSGEKGMELAFGDEPPDMILLDIMMPDVDGLEVCRRLKADPRTRNIPVIFLTSRNSSKDEMQGFEAGAVDYIHKPISPGILRARVTTHLALTAAAARMNALADDARRHLDTLTAGPLDASQRAAVADLRGLLDRLRS